ncbi:MAG: NAD(P)-binding protein, partial [Verrucomicrobiales bacterium]
MPREKVDFLIVGAGFSGLVVGERLAASGFKCVVVDRRDHLGGNAYDAVNHAGVLTHRYGPHYFRSNSKKIVDYLSRFTAWHQVSYEIKSFTDGRFWSFPINLNTFEEICGETRTSEDFECWLREKRVLVENPSNSEEVIISQVGRDLYKRFFEGYTLKQWKR